MYNKDKSICRQTTVIHNVLKVGQIGFSVHSSALPSTPLAITFLGNFAMQISRALFQIYGDTVSVQTYSNNVQTITTILFNSQSYSPGPSCFTVFLNHFIKDDL